LEQKAEWKGLPIVIMVKSRRTIGESTREETWYHISSLAPIAKTFGTSIRENWEIENSLQ
jgi:hypothetical protein